jgi:hypothetical protein
MKTRPFGQDCNIKQIQFIERVFIPEQNLQTDKTNKPLTKHTDEQIHRASHLARERSVVIPIAQSLKIFSAESH